MYYLLGILSLKESGSLSKLIQIAFGPVGQPESSQSDPASVDSAQALSIQQVALLASFYAAILGTYLAVLMGEKWFKRRTLRS